MTQLRLLLPFCIACLLCSSVAVLGQEAPEPEQTVLAGKGMYEKPPSSLYRVERITFEGLDRTRENTVLRGMTFGVGAYLPKSSLDTLLEINERLIYNTGLFTRVDVTPTTTDSTVSLLVVVSERWYLWPEFVFELEDLTVQDWFENPDWQRVTIGAKLKQKNLTGRSDDLTLQYTQGYQRSVGIEYAIPFLFPEKLIGMKVKFLRTQNDEVLYGSTDGTLLRVREEGNTLLEKMGVGVGLEKRYSQFLFGGISLGYSETQIADTLRVLNPEFLRSPIGYERNFVVSLGVTNDTRDVRKFPLHGHLAKVTASYNGLDPWQGAHYGRLEMLYFRYRQLQSSRFYTAFGGEIAMILGRELGFKDKLQLGNNGVRGFNSFVIDGTLITTGKFEIRYALIERKIRTWKRLPRQFRDFPFGVYPYAFVDVGYVLDDVEVASSEKRYKDKPLGGWGVGVDIPNVYDNLLRVEYAWNSFGQASLLFNFSVALR